jgi:hypothetical protein
VPSYAVTLASKPTTIDGILLIIDDRQEAQEIAAELRRNGQQVYVQEILPANDAATSGLRSFQMKAS